MAITEYEYKKGFPAIRLTHPTGSASVELLLYGAHVFSWTVQNKQILFLRFVLLIFVDFIFS
jgi:D-hexose-6-phosphate mutarotase